MMLIFGSRASDTTGPAIPLQLIRVHPVIAVVIFREYRRHGKYEYMNTVYYFIPLIPFCTILTYDESIEMSRK